MFSLYGNGCIKLSNIKPFINRYNRDGIKYS